MQITRNVTDTQPGPSEWFTGTVFLDAVAVPADGSRITASSVHFTPGARTAWHTHPNGQTIYVTEGVGFAQSRGGSIEVIRPGDRVFFEPGEEHWHGAAPDRFMTHLAMLEVGDDGQPGHVGRPRHRRGVRCGAGNRRLGVFVVQLSTQDVVLVRHGETEWSREGKHTGHTDIPLTERGRLQAQAVRSALQDRHFALVLTSPLARALETCRLAGFGDVAELRDELREWDYGAFEGRRTIEIREERPGWTLWREGVPEGDTIDEVAARADRVIAELRAVQGDALLFAHGHVLRVLTARWLGLEPPGGRAVRARPSNDQRARLRAGNLGH